MPKFQVRMKVDAFAYYYGEINAPDAETAKAWAHAAVDYDATPEIVTFDDRAPEVLVDDEWKE